jgi:malonyl CoA-acyl carrier protein transacylase
MEHTVYLSAKAFIEAVKPRAPMNKKSTKNGTVSVEDDAGEDIDDDNTWTMDWVERNPIADDKEVDNIIDFSPGDVLGKVLALVNQVRFFF